jgi:acyl-CoA synthetase (NDP forming)
VDLAVIAVPAPAVDDAVDDCLVKGVPAIVVISAGFGETGADGRAREEALRARVRAAGGRMIGPNCMGVVNTEPAVRLNATFSPVCPPAGSIAFSSQSGALGLAVLDYAKRLEVGISQFVSVGNKVDVSTNDLIEFWGDDPRTNVILLYVESFGNPRKFSRIARRVARNTPIVAVKAGRSTAGSRAAASHTGALAASDTVVDALFHDAGVIRAGTLEELFDVGRLLASQPLPAGPGVAILTNAGGPGIMAADACEAFGLTVAQLSQATGSALRALLPAAAGISNPIDMLATATADDYARAIPLLLRDPAVDSLIAIFVPPLVTRRADVARVIAAAARGTSKPILAALVGGEGSPADTAPAPGYGFPESAARALARVVSYVGWRRTAVGHVPDFHDVDRDIARAIVEHAPVSADGWLLPLDAYALLDAFGIPHVPTIAVGSEGDAVDLARRVGLPVALKGAGRDVVHKARAHAVEINLIDDAAVRRAYGLLASRRGHDLNQILVQPMVYGAEFLVGAVLDPTFGHVVVCGTGGSMVEQLHDTSCRLHPLSDMQAAEMLTEIKGLDYLRQTRSQADFNGVSSSIRDILLRVSALVEACPEVVDIDVNPIIMTPAGAKAVDVRVRLDRTAAGPSS